MEKIKIDILPNYFVKADGTFDKENALILCGKIAGVCYDKEGFKHLENEDIEKTKRRIDLTLNNGHHSVYDHINISFNIQNIPKILAMVINNEHQYTTSEKSARYTPVVRTDDSVITLKEEELYNKWLEIFKGLIKDKYGDIYGDVKIRRLAQENARYLVTVFTPAQMIYTTSLRQINYLVSWMRKYINDIDKNNDFEVKLALYMENLISELERLNVLEDALLKNEKNRTISLFGKNLDKKEEYFGDIYQTKYEGSFAFLAHAQRHRTLDYQMSFYEKDEYFIPPILEKNKDLVKEWLKDISLVRNIIPQGLLIQIAESGKYEDFILKCKERLCSAVQLETMKQTRDTLLKYSEALKEKEHHLASDMEKYTHGARCTFCDYKCPEDCKFKEGKILTRKI